MVRIRGAFAPHFFVPKNKKIHPQFIPKVKKNAHFKAFIC